MEQSFYGQLVFGEGVSSSLDEQLAKEAEEAMEVKHKQQFSFKFRSPSQT